MRFKVWTAFCRSLVAPILLCMVALNHAYRVHVHELTPWKGGGFGMFSTVDSHSSRLVRAFLVSSMSGKQATIAVEIPQDDNDFRVLAKRTRAEPSQSNVSTLARELACLEFRVYGLMEKGVDSLRQEADDFASLSSNRVRSRQFTQPDERILSVALAYEGVRVEVTRVVFDGATLALRTEAMSKLEVPRRDPDSPECEVQPS